MQQTMQAHDKTCSLIYFVKETLTKKLLLLDAYSSDLVSKAKIWDKIERKQMEVKRKAEIEEQNKSLKDFIVHTVKGARDKVKKVHKISEEKKNEKVEKDNKTETGHMEDIQHLDAADRAYQLYSYEEDLNPRERVSSIVSASSTSSWESSSTETGTLGSSSVRSMDLGRLKMQLLSNDVENDSAMETIADLVAEKTYTKLSLDIEKLSDKIVTQSSTSSQNSSDREIKTLEKKIEHQETFIYQLMKDVHEMKSLLQPRAEQINNSSGDELDASKKYRKPEQQKPLQDFTEKTIEKETLGQKRSKLKRMPTKESLEAGWIRNTLEEEKVKIDQEERDKMIAEKHLQQND